MLDHLTNNARRLEAFTTTEPDLDMELIDGDDILHGTTADVAAWARFYSPVYLGVPLAAATLDMVRVWGHGTVLAEPAWVDERGRAVQASLVPATLPYMNNRTSTGGPRAITFRAKFSLQTVTGKSYVAAHTVDRKAEAAIPAYILRPALMKPDANL